MPTSLQWSLTRSAGGSDFSKWIDALTGGLGYAHAFVFDNDLHLTYESWFPKGLRAVQRDPNLEREILFDFPNFDGEREREMRRLITFLCGDHRGYDSNGALRLAGLPLVSQDEDSFFCSEAVVTFGQAAGYFPGVDPWDISPNAMPAMTIE